MVFGNGVKNIQGAAYNGAHTVIKSLIKFDLLTLQDIYGSGMLYQIPQRKSQFQFYDRLFKHSPPPGFLFFDILMKEMCNILSKEDCFI